MDAKNGRLVERDKHLQVLDEILKRARDSSGRVVVLSGEAGVGKTSLLRKFTAELDQNSMAYWGSCDALFTPRPLGPLQDIALRLDEKLAHQLETGAEPSKIFARFLAVIEAHETLPVLVFEDVHWADTATLDLIKFLGRRMSSLRAILLLSLRTDEVTRGHPISRILGDLTPASLRRLEIAPLTADGVRQLTRETSFDAERLYKTTGGNPFFVSELLSSGSGEQSLPASIKDAIRSRRARIGRSANTTLNALSIFPTPTPNWLLTNIARATGSRSTDECVAAGLIVRNQKEELGFRHELARLAVLEDMTERSRQSLHAKALNSLKEARAAGRAVQISTIIHHAAGAGDGHELLRLAPLAATEAARMGAHAQAAEHLKAALAYAELATAEQGAELYESWSYEAALAVKIDESIIDARHQAIRLWRSIGRQDKVGLNLRWLARLHWYRGEAQEADRYLSEALIVLESLPPGPELAMAYAIRSQMLMLHRRRKEAISWGNRAIALARTSGATETLVHALNTVGTSKLYAGQMAGMRMLEESLARSLDEGLHEQAARAYTNITSCAVSRKDFEVAELFSAQGIKFDSEHDLDSWTHYLVGYQAQMRLDQGRLEDARDIADSVERLEHLTLLMRMPASIVNSLARARLTAEADYGRLDQTLADASSIGELQYLVPARLALIEASWLWGESELAAKHVNALSDLPLDRLNPWNFGDVAVWFHRCGMSLVYKGKRQRLPAPRQLEVAGRYAEAADALLSLGMRYDAALTLAHTSGGAVAKDLTKALQLFENAGAKSGVAFVRRRAAMLGVSKQLPRPKRGPYAKSRSHPLGLTGREVQILRYVKEGLSNREISIELGRSERTVEHHMSAVLAKLGARNRIEALIRIQTEPWLLGSSEE